MNMRENFFRIVEFKKPQWIPFNFIFPPLAQRKYENELIKLCSKYPLVFNSGIGFGDSFFKETEENHYYKKGYVLDSWGCLWYNTKPGLKGQVVKGAIEDWNDFKNYRAPDPLRVCPNEWGSGLMHNWSLLEEDIKKNKETGIVAWGNAERLFDRLYFLRGFENLMLDFATEHSNLPKLIEILYEYEDKLVRKLLEIGVDAMFFHTDIGTQNGLMISPQHFRKYLKPMFKDLFTTCRKAGVPVYLGSDGKIIEIIDDLLECGVSIHDPQLGPNSLEEIRKYYKGKMTIYLDLDRQKFPIYSPKQIKEMIKKSIDVLSSSEGGLMLMACIFDDTVPIENIEAICQGIMEYAF